MREPGKRRRGIPTFAFVVDGETEIWYLQMLKKNEQRDRNIRINIKPEIPQKKKLEDQYDLVCEQAKGVHDKVFWIVDLDVILKETKEARSDNTPLRYFISLIDELASKSRKDPDFKKVEVIVNNPCLEYWFLLHFELTEQTYINCGEVMVDLRRHLPGYSKSERYFKKKDNDIYTRLRPYIDRAIHNAESLGSFDKGNPTKGVCEMNTLFLCDELRAYFE